MRLLAAVFALLLAGCSGPGTAGPPAVQTSHPPASEPPLLPAITATPPPGASPVQCSASHAPRDFIDSVRTVDGDRSFRLHIPASYATSGPVPLVLNFHGSHQSGLHQEIYSGLVPIADREGFVLVSPEAAGYGEWDIVGFYADIGVDDIGFTGTLLDYLESSLCIDPARIYATGMSNGAEMASQAACFFPDRFAAIAPVAGVTYQGCGGPPVPVISFHGTEDYNVPFEETPPAMEAWAEHNGCSADFSSGQVSDHVVRQSYESCDGADVVLYVVDGGGHSWPGADESEGGVGPTTHEINASELIWQFFAAHSKR